MFTMWIFVAILVYSTHPGGAPPFQRAEVKIVEFSQQACRDTLADVLARPKPFVLGFTGQAATWTSVTPLRAWTCVPLEVGD